MRTCTSKEMEKNTVEKPELYNLRLLYCINIFLIITDYLMPQYFGVHIGWDITCTRLANIILAIYGLLVPQIFKLFGNIVINCISTWPLAIYLFVTFYTMIFRIDINAFMMPFLEIFTLYNLIFGIRYVIGYLRAIKISIFCAYFLGIYGLIEYGLGYSVYLKFLRTVPTSVTNVYRSGQYRIMGPCGHPLGYGLLLILLIAFACYDLKRDEIYLFRRPVLMVLLLLNVFLTGSRSTLAVACIELVAIFACSSWRNMQKTFWVALVFVVVFGITMLLIYNTKIGQYIMMQLTSLVDEVLGTQYAVNFGADLTRLQNSSEYREYLPTIFKLDWLNPLLGRGIKRKFSCEVITPTGVSISLKSIDNYYICQYIKYAYPGMISYLLFMLVTGITMVKTIVKNKSAIVKLILVSFCCYYLNLWWLDALQTLKYEYISLAIFYAYYFSNNSEPRNYEKIFEGPVGY